VTPQLDLGVDVMVESKKVNLVGVMGPEHGFRGTSQNGGGESTFVDEKTGLTVYDAYNVNSSVIEGYIHESGADTVLFDIQDVGARFYTCEFFSSTWGWGKDGVVTDWPCWNRHLGPVRHHGCGGRDKHFVCGD
jgi:uncharacterized protein YbbC (DUF1343 family)